MSPSPVMGRTFKEGSLPSMKAEQSRSCAQDSGAQLLSYIATHSLRGAAKFP